MTLPARILAALKARHDACVRLRDEPGALFYIGAIYAAEWLAQPPDVQTARLAVFEAATSEMGKGKRRDG